MRGSALGVRFRRQHAIGQFIVDFYSPAAHLVVELDGSSHEGRAAEGRERQEYLESLGLAVLRFTNEEVLSACDKVIETIRVEVMKFGLSKY